MLCPIDSTTLVISERQGVEIDYCPQCRGVWLDRGELDKILDRADRDDRDDRVRAGGDDWDDDRRRHGGYDSRAHYPPRKKKKGWLNEMFEFD